MSNVSLVDGHIDEPKMTDEEIIKALESCIVDDFYKIRNALCAKCAYCQYTDCKRRLQQDALDLINRKDAEIERLNKILENRGEICKLCEGKYTEKIKRAKSEAIKAFAHLLIDKAKKGVIYAMDIPDYVIEMVGD